MLERTYSLRSDAPPAMAWDDYVALVESEWSELLANAKASEPEVHRFLERHPAMVPGASGIGTRGKHGPIHGAVFSKPKLPGLHRPEPDFMWILRDSGRVLAIMVEIERPQKRWFTNKGQETAELTQATGQIAQWKAWFNQPDNVNQFRRLYRIPDHYNEGRSFKQFYLLVYGRQQELLERPELNRQRDALLADDIERMTYDRLQPDPWVEYCLCVRIRRGALEAVTVPPTLRLGPNIAEDLRPLRRKAEAAMRSPYISAERKVFLVERFVYWDAWAAEGGKGVTRGSDWE
jgi:hypothetical protein